MYATANDMRDRFGEARLVQLTDTPAWGAATIAAIETRLGDASERIDGYVARYYKAAPGQPVPKLLTIIACDIAFADLATNPTDDAISRRKAAIRDLEHIATGKMKLDGGDIDALESRDGQLLVPDAPRTFTRDGLRSF